MKTSIFKYLPIAAALTLATSCSNDENIIPEQPVLDAESIQPEFVKVPFTVKVNTEGKSLSKIGTETINDNGTEKIKFSFKDEDVDNLVVLVEGTDDDDNNCFQEKYQFLTLKKINGEFVFTGDFLVKSQDEEQFKAGKCWLSAYLMEKDVCDYYINHVGTFTPYLEKRIDANSLEELTYYPGFFEATIKSNWDHMPLQTMYACVNIEDSKDQLVNVSVGSRDFTLDVKKYNWFAFYYAMGENIVSSDLNVDFSPEGTTRIFRIRRN